MILQLKYINTYSTNPYRNLAFEEYMLNNVNEGECILYLWQNRHTVVIGKNQNAYKECNISALEADGGFLARRPSGGGAVYHDNGNLNFTFITTANNYNLDKQLSVIIEAVGDYAIHARQTGRNDISIDDRKFSGNAFLVRGEKMYHHGTILVDVNMSSLSKYLNVSEKKLKAKSVDSVKSRVVNLRELNREISIDSMRRSLVCAFEKVYAQKSAEIKEESIYNADVEALINKYTSEQWRFGKNAKADFELSDKFSWGEVSIRFCINSSTIDDVSVFTDAMDTGIAEKIESILLGEKFYKNVLINKLNTSGLGIVAGDLAQLIRNSEI